MSDPVPTPRSRMGVTKADITRLAVDAIVIFVCFSNDICAAYTITLAALA